jgi:heptosyltransferase-1
MADLRRRLRAGDWDVAIDMQGLLRSALVCRLSGAPVRIGLGSKELSWSLMSHLVERGGDHRLIGSEYRYLAERLGLDASEWPLKLHLAEKNHRAAEELLAAEGLEEGRFAVFVPFTTRPQKHWFEDRWADLIERAPHEIDLPVVVLGGPADRPALERILEGARERRPDVEVVDLVGRTSLGDAAAVIARAGLLIGVDTGLTHVGSAFERPTVCIWGSNWPYVVPPAETTRILFSPLDCAPCRGHPTCEGRFTCMQLIAVPQVLAAAREVLRTAAA